MRRIGGFTAPIKISATCSKGKQVDILALHFGLGFPYSFWDLFVATQKNLKTEGRGGGRDFFSV